MREGDTPAGREARRLARSTPDLYRIVSQLAEKHVEFKMLDDPAIDTSSRTGKLPYPGGGSIQSCRPSELDARNGIAAWAEVGNYRVTGAISCAKQ